MVRLRTLYATRRSGTRLSPLVQLLFCYLGSVLLSAAQGDSSMDECYRRGSFWCSRGAKCIDPKKRCNGVSWDCPYNEDESNCSKPTMATSKLLSPTAPTLFLSGGGCYLCGGVAPCIVSKLYCDGEIDCPEGDDEINCRSLDDNPPKPPRPDWVWPVMSTVAGLVGGALLCTATALLVQRYRRVRRQRRRRELECEAAAEASSGNTCTRDVVAVVVNPPPYDEALERPFATQNPVYFSTADAPPKYVDIVVSTQSPSAPPPQADAIYAEPCQTAADGATPGECAASGTIAAAGTSAPT